MPAAEAIRLIVEQAVALPELRILLELGHAGPATREPGAAPLGYYTGSPITYKTILKQLSI